MPNSKPTVVIGGGIVGLATALAISKRFPEQSPLVLEKEDHVAAHQTGHNSGVIHSGLYYKPGSLKARFAVAAAQRMVEFCREHDVAHWVCGKVVVATRPDELPLLEALLVRGRENQVPGVEMIGPEQLREIEPHAFGLRALRVPTTGIIDFPGATRRYAELLTARGGQVRTKSGVTGLRRESNGWTVETTAGTVEAGYIIGCAGLHADRVAQLAGLDPQVKVVPFRGEYFKLIPSREDLVKTLIYPVPDPQFPFLGVHFTRMILGGVEAGPNAVLGLKREGYGRTDFDFTDATEILRFPGFHRLAMRHWKKGIGELYRSFSKPAFVRLLQRLLPELQAADLVPGGSGVRAQAMRADGSLVEDFSFEEGERSLHIINAPSPAATASLLIGEEVASRAAKSFGWD